MKNPEKSLHIVFVAGASGEELLSGKRTLHWTAPKTARKGDVALFYVGGEDARAIFGIGVTAEDAWPGKPRRSWTESRRGNFARYRQVVLLSSPLPLDAIRSAFPTWRRWDYLRGVRVHTVPEKLRVPLAKWIVAENLEARDLLGQWLHGQGAAPALATGTVGELRYEGAKVSRTHIVYERSQTNRNLALAAAKPPYTCEGCGFNFAATYGLAGKGFIEVHHAKPVSHGHRKPKPRDFLVVCSNCHSIVHWRRGDRPLSLKQLRALVKRAR